MSLEAEQAAQEPAQDRTQMLRGAGMYVASVPSKLLLAFAFMRLWAWFVVPLGVRGLGYWHSVGLLFLLAFVRGWWEVHPTSGPSRKLLWEDTLGTIFYEAVGSVASLGIGWLIHLLA